VGTFLGLGLIYLLLNFLGKEGSSSLPPPASSSDDTSLHFK
jgi:hypothetical protein